MRRQGDCVLAILAAEELEKRFVTAEAEQNDEKRDLVKSASIKRTPWRP